ncbi:hypothetical protein ABR737_33615 [Streptomyces sp. Edi2]|uniref:hypothetical protein n=1 Tax=Streptomyces sp. Edi2 TaxID=3162528 RepID=UPI003305890A
MTTIEAAHPHTTGKGAGYEPTQAESVLARLSPHSPRPQRSNAELQALRMARFASATSRTPRPRVGIYALVNAGQDPAPRLAMARALVTQHDWLPDDAAAVDSTGMTDPATRPQLARLLAALARGDIDGMVAASKADFTHLNDYYEDVLHQVHACGGFLALATPETSI